MCCATASKPTVSVIGVQIGYVLGSLVAIEKVFNYPGLGLTIANAASKDPPVLVAGVLVVAIVYMLATLGRRSGARLDEPTGPPGGESMSATTPLTTAASAMPPSAQVRSERSQARRERWRLLRRRPGFIVGCIVLLFWIVCAVGGERISPYGPLQTGFPPSQAPTGSHPFGTDQLGRDVLSRVMAGARDVLLVAPFAALLSVIAGTLFGLVGGYIRGVTDDVISRVMEAILAIPAILIGPARVHHVRFVDKPVQIFTIAFLFTPIVFRTVRAVDARRGRARLRHVGPAARRTSALFIMTREIVPNITGPIVVELTVRVGYAIFTIATLKFIAGSGKPEEPEWGNRSAQTYGLDPGRHLVADGVPGAGHRQPGDRHQPDRRLARDGRTRHERHDRPDAELRA